MTHPQSPTYLDQQVARVAAVLGAQNVFDAAPLELYCMDFETVTLFFKYTREAAGGAFAFRVDISPNRVGTQWFRETLYASQAVATGVDSRSDFQREDIEYGSTGAAAELTVYGPIYLNGAIERIRVAAAETSAAGPGMLEIRAVFGAVS